MFFLFFNVLFKIIVKQYLVVVCFIFSFFLKVGLFYVFKQFWIFGFGVLWIKEQKQLRGFIVYIQILDCDIIGVYFKVLIGGNVFVFCVVFLGRYGMFLVVFFYVIRGVLRFRYGFDFVMLFRYEREINFCYEQKY